ncbi:hypothetical protein PUW24_16190 [Paenibacillus urinalis]|uniref:Uncharacterized protein n=1 Tax=Paenibacillus urinalis TaxID=521520 RepID=A0ABY7XDR5_9BACL|nr:hypothetical protein [Paenibacillus urinalis]WDH95741.1 hypothetical protein PUW24_16190 [Paenibacillus urinalis]WDI03937.1 hypothetical protein PUW25_08305 [Paenibacillus urinalis]
MSTLLDLLNEANVQLSLFCEKLEITEDHALEIATTADYDTQMDTYLQFVTVLNDESLLPELLDFYAPFVKDKGELVAFITSVLRLRSNNVPRRMLNSVHRLLTLADAMDEVRPGKDSLKVFHFVVCIESLYHLRDGDVDNKTLAVIDFFTNYIEEDDRLLILDCFHRNLADEKFNIHKRPGENYEEYQERLDTSVDRTFNTRVTIDIFARVVNEIRNCFAHEGDYWNFHFANGDHTMMNSLTVAESQTEASLKRKRIFSGLRRIYSVDLTYEQFKAACVRGYLQFIRSYIETLNT